MTDAFRDLMNLMFLPGVPVGKRALVHGALVAADRDGSHTLDQKARMIAEAFDLPISDIRPLVQA